MNHIRCCCALIPWCRLCSVLGARGWVSAVWRYSCCSRSRRELLDLNIAPCYSTNCAESRISEHFRQDTKKPIANSCKEKGPMITGTRELYRERLLFFFSFFLSLLFSLWGRRAGVEEEGKKRVGKQICWVGFDFLFFLFCQLHVSSFMEGATGLKKYFISNKVA